MVKFSDFSKLTDKLDVSGLVKNVKSMVNPEHSGIETTAINASADGSDALSQKMAEINAAVQSLVDAHSQQSEAVVKLKKSLVSLSAEIEKLRSASSQAAVRETSTPGTAQQTKPESDASYRSEISENKPEAGN